MSLQIDTTDSILIDGRDTGLKLTQRRDGTVVYTPEGISRKYAEHKMPFARYSVAHDVFIKEGQAYNPRATAGRVQLEADIHKLLVSL